MTKTNLNGKIINATKWSSITEIAAKLISPITNMILARILVPEAFGVVATVTMIVSFAEMFTDSGFQKYIIQYDFKSNDEKYKHANVAFWTNFLLSLILWLVIFIFREQIAIFVGNPGLGNVLAIACIQLPLTSFSSIQMALFRRSFDFKTLFFARLVTIFIPFIITIPLALLGFSYWSIIIGSLIIQLSNAIILTLKSNWKPRLFYSVKILKSMFSFSLWSLIEAISIWFTTWIDAFIIANALSQFELGIYRTSTTMVNTLMSLITATIIPVLFSTLSRVKSDEELFKNIYFKFQWLVAFFLIPLGLGLYIYNEFATKVMLGNQWSLASEVIGISALTLSIQIVFGHFCSEVYRAKGNPKLSFIAQFLHLIVLVPACIISSRFGFWPLVYTRAWIRMELVLVHFIIMKYKFGFPIIKTITNVYPILISSFVMGTLGYYLSGINDSIIWNIISIFTCIIAFLFIMFLFPSNRSKIHMFINNFKSNKL